MGPDFEFYDNANFSHILKAEGNICTGYSDYRLKMTFSPFITIMINHFRQSLSQYTTHFYLILSILEDINSTIEFVPLFMDNLLAYYYVIPSGARYILYK